MSIACVPHFIVDNFLPDEVHKGLLAHTLNVDDFAPGKVITNGEAAYNFDSRKGKLSNDRLGPFLPAFIKALRSVFPDICAATGVAEFALVDIEIRLAMHSDGDFRLPPSNHSPWNEHSTLACATVEHSVSSQRADGVMGPRRLDLEFGPGIG